MANQEYKQYKAHNWQASERIDAELLNHMEVGIENLSNKIVSDFKFITDFQSNMNTYIDTINNKMNELDSYKDNFENTANTAINTAINNRLGDYALKSSVEGLLKAIYGSNATTYENEGAASLKAWIQSELSKLASSTTITSMQTNISDLQTTAARIQTALGTDYNLTQSSWDSNSISTRLSNLSTDLSSLNNTVRGTSTSGSTTKTIVEQIADLNEYLGLTSSSVETNSLIDKIESALGRSLEPTAEEINTNNNLNYSLLELIEALQTVLGLSNAEEGEPSLIQKIESALGRPLNPTAEQIQEDELLDDSLLSLIKTIRDTLGMSGGTSGGTSNLIQKIDTIVATLYGTSAPSSYALGDNYTLARVLDDLYGKLLIDPNTEEISRENPLIDTLSSLPASVSTLNTKVKGLEDDKSSYIRKDSTEASIWNNITSSAYINADWKRFEAEDETYLRLIRKDKDWPATVADLANETVNTYIPLPKGGGGGGAAGSGTAIVTRITDATVQVLVGKSCYLRYRLEARDNGGVLSGAGTATWFIGGVQVATSSAANIKANDDTTTINEFDISPYLSVGSNSVMLQISVDTGGDTPSIVRRTWTVDVINLSLIWNYNEENIFDAGTITLEWIPYGAGINKTTYMIIDNEEPVAISETVQSGITQSYTFEHNLSHGAHTCKLYLAATINNIDETTEIQSHDIIVVQPLDTTPIISSSAIITEMEQYDTVAIPIVIYTPNSTVTNNVILAEDGEIKDTWNNVNRTLQTWNYSPSTVGVKTLTITVGSVVKTIKMTVKSISITNAEVEGYDFKIKASDIISNTALRNNELLSFSDNFDWINGGLKTEKDLNGNIQQYICIKAGTTMTVNKQLFNSNLSTGLNFKIILKTANCSDYDAKILDCYSNDIGLELFAHSGILKSSVRQVTTQFSENTYIELEFEVYGTNNNIRYIMCWVDGVMSSVRVCDENDNFEQSTKVPIVIGSENCDVHIYLLKNYYKTLSISEHIANFIADAPNATIMKARYNRNDILGKDNEIDYNRLRTAAPDCRIWLYDIHRMTTGKKDKVNVYRFQQFWENDKTEYFNGLYAENATLTVQGTSSVNYRKGAANTDIDFSGENCILRSGNGEDLLADNLEIKGMKITETSIPITYANLKVNFASCEQVNNMCNAMWYQNFQPYPSLSNRDCMEFVMGVQFIHDRGLDEPTAEDPTTKQKMLEVPLFSEKTNRDANKYYMYSIGNLGTSKKNTHIFHSENECCIEVTDNTTEGQRMIAWPTNLDWSGDVKEADHSYEVRYPKKINDTIAAGWERFVKWMAENNPRAATNRTLITPETYPAYTFKGHNRPGTQVLQGTTVSQYAGTYTTDSFERRMAKMLSECEDYMAMDSVVYHFCFIERHTMVDNVAKNTFWSAEKTVKEINGVETEGYWIWDLSKNYDNDTSDGNNNEGQLVFDYGNEANDSINGKMVFNAADSVWFIFISNLREACATMFINRESAYSNDGKYMGAWNSLSYHNFLLQQQQKVPERVWNECYWYDYLRTYENNIDRSWISFLDGGQKIQQRKHYELFQELYLASKYMSPLSIGNMITMRGYTPTITENMTEEQKAIIRATLAAVPSKSEVTVTMYNKCYLTVHMGNNFLQQKVEKGVPTTLTFKEHRPNWDENITYLVNDKVSYQEHIWVSKINNNINHIPSENSEYWELSSSYLGLMDTVINIDTASMVQEIGDLSPLYPGQSSFGAAYRLRSIKIGSAHPDYQNLNISETETGAFDFSTNAMLERLEIQNLKSVNAPLTLTGCPALKYLDASGSSFTGYSFADGGLVTTAKLGNPNTITMRNLSYLADANLTIDSTINLKYLTIDNCPLIDSFNRVQTLNELLNLNLLNVNWRVPGIDFNNFVNYVKGIPTYLVTGKVELTQEMGSFNINNLGDTFTKDLKFYYYDKTLPAWEQRTDGNGYSEGDRVHYNERIWVSNKNNNIDIPHEYSETVPDSEKSWLLQGNFPQPYYTVAFYGLYGNDFIGNQYIPSGSRFASNAFDSYFSNQYIKDYNIFKNPSWTEGMDTRLSKGPWSINDNELVISDLDVYAREVTQYKLTYIMHTADPEVFLSDTYFYYEAGKTISKSDVVMSDVPSFVRDYYKYTGEYWTATDNRGLDPTAAQEEIPGNVIKEPYAETWYAVYKKTPNEYTISIYNTDRNGQKQGEPLYSFTKNVVSSNSSNNEITYSELQAYRPGIGSSAKDKAIYIDETTMYQADLNQEKEENRLYRFLNWRPYVSLTSKIPVTGDMDILATYYKTDDVFTNYFLNKLTDCTLKDDITSLPDGAFLHNSNLTKLSTKASTIGKGSFSLFNDNNRRVFIFTNNNVSFNTHCFYNARNCLIIFTGTGSINVNDYAFDEIRNCTLIVLNSDEPIRTNGQQYYSFSNFYGNNNILYVTSNAYSRYVANNARDNIPNNLSGQESYLSVINIINDTNIKSLLEEAGLE